MIRGLRAARVMLISLVLACGHGAAPKTAGDRTTPDRPNCVELVVGTAREEAVLCEETDYNYWTVTHQVVRVVRAGKTVPVLDLLTKIEAFDSGAIWLEQRLRIGADGMSAILDGVPITDVSARHTGQPGPFEDCNHASDWKGSPIEGEPKYRDLRRQSCNALGAYQWNGGRFVHQRGR
ncbi:MAG TPA: hypothetical protein VFV99_20315 [Kofleriaceae bacterium]|nr:hypothetical protein [Kofleriaceae bacterium]